MPVDWGTVMEGGFGVSRVFGPAVPEAWGPVDSVARTVTLGGISCVTMTAPGWHPAPITDARTAASPIVLALLIVNCMTLIGKIFATSCANSEHPGDKVDMN
jgi:hypothetical protein